uniref:Uncharacterized protein n=1 Tax=viral metagenome TaxID=1070528 RepID=A0A6M3IK29_9ZZZZ
MKDSEFNACFKGYSESKISAYRDIMEAHVLMKAALKLSGLPYFRQDLLYEMEDVKHSVLVEFLECLKKGSLLKADNPAKYVSGIIDNVVLEYLKKEWKHSTPKVCTLDDILDMPSNLQVFDFNAGHLIGLVQAYTPSLLFPKLQGLTEAVIFELKTTGCKNYRIQVRNEKRFAWCKQFKTTKPVINFLKAFYAKDLKEFLINNY